MASASDFGGLRTDVKLSRLLPAAQSYGRLAQSVSHGTQVCCPLPFQRAVTVPQPTVSRSGNLFMYALFLAPYT